MIEREYRHNRRKGLINRADFPNNTQNTIKTIPSININIIIYHWRDASEDGIIDSNESLIERKKHIRRTVQMH